jgi:diadenosine tetraphosphatase ApaH/serine/threonine PP2A family protein phosphatase
VHGNLQALDAVLRAAREASVDDLWCLGDMVGYGADPVGCMDACMEAASRCLAGNHDLGAAGRLSLETFADWAYDALLWTQRALGPERLRALGRLAPADADDGVPLYHASVLDPVWEYVLSPEQALASLLATEAPLVLTGHTHVPAAWCLGDDGRLSGGFVEGEVTVLLAAGRWLVNPGAVGQPRDEDPRAAWAILDPEARTLTFRREEYDIEGAQEAILAAGLPASLALRLEHGR